MDNKLISVIVACYNVERYLDRCVESILGQTYSDLEIILVDDGSTDKTGQLCDCWAGRDARVQVLHKANGGLSDARNAGIKKAHGKWLGFVDGDDFIRSTMYERLYEQRTEWGITVCGFETEKAGERNLCPAIDAEMKPEDSVNLYIGNELQCHYSGVFTYFGSYSGNKLYDHCLFDCVTYPKGKKYEDMYIIFDLLHAARKVHFISSCEYIYVQNPDSITHAGEIIHESLFARIKQKEQLKRYWGKIDSRMDELVACEYFLILFRYSFLSTAEQLKNKETAKWAWRNIHQIGYSRFPLKMKLKSLLFMYFPRMVRGLRHIYHLR